MQGRSVSWEEGEASLWCVVWFLPVNFGIHLSSCLLLIDCHQPPAPWRDGETADRGEEDEKRIGRAEEGEGEQTQRRRKNTRYLKGEIWKKPRKERLLVNNKTHTISNTPPPCNSLKNIKRWFIPLEWLQGVELTLLYFQLLDIISEQNIRRCCKEAETLAGKFPMIGCSLCYKWHGWVADIGNITESLFSPKAEGQQEPWLSLNVTDAQEWPHKCPGKLPQ